MPSSSSVVRSEYAGSSACKGENEWKIGFGRPLVVHLATEKYLVEATNPPNAIGEEGKLIVTGNPSGQMSRSAKIAAIKNKLKAMEEESCSAKKPRQADHSS